MSKTLSNRLTVLAVDIKAAHSAIKASAEQMAEQAIAAGNMLIEAKTAVRHGEWCNWLDKNVGMSERTAQRYMQLARSGMKSATVADLGIRAATEALAATHPVTSEMPDDILDFVTMWYCMIYTWVTLPPKDRARVRTDTVAFFASTSKGLPLVPAYLNNTDHVERLVTSGQLTPSDLPQGGDLFATVKRALVETRAEERS